VYDPPVTVINDVYHPQIVEVVHVINVVDRHHCVPVEKHLYQYCHHNEVASENEGNRSRSCKSGRPSISKAKSRRRKK
jgi:hypothetical protein